MQSMKILGLLIAATMLLVCSVSAIEIPTVNLPSVDVPVLSGTTESTVDLYRPAPPCWECQPEPTPAPVYSPIGLSVTCPKTRIMMNSNAQLMATQVSGTPVLSTASWDWVINRANGTGFGAKGQVVSFKVNSFGRWRINLNVRDSVQMLNGHYTGDVYFTEKR